jgi:hypothetical protein
MNFSEGNLNEMSSYNLSSEMITIYGTVELNVLKSNDFFTSWPLFINKPHYCLTYEVLLRETSIQGIF